MTKIIEAEVAIIGSGPGGAMLALRLARLGRKVVLIERAANLHREFRGESISPDSVAILEEMGLMPYLDAHGYLETKKMQVFENNTCLLEVDFSQFDIEKKYSIDIPQPVLISALIKEAEKRANFIYLNSIP